MTLWEEIWQYLEENYFNVSVNNRYAYLQFNNHTGTTLFALVLGLCVGMLAACYYMAFQRVHIGRFVRRLLRRGAHAPDTAVTLEEVELYRDVLLKAALGRASAVRKTVNVVTKDRILVADRYYDELTDDVEEAELARTAEARRQAEKETLRAEEQVRREKLRAAFGGGAVTEAEEAATPTTDAKAEHTEENNPTGDAERAENATDTATTEQTGQKDRHLHRLPKIDFEHDRFYIPEEKKFRAETRFAKDKFLPLTLIGATLAFFLLVFGLIRLIPVALGFLDGSLIAVFG